MDTSLQYEFGVALSVLSSEELPKAHDYILLSPQWCVCSLNNTYSSSLFIYFLHTCTELWAQNTHKSFVYNFYISGIIQSVTKQCVFLNTWNFSFPRMLSACPRIEKSSVNDGLFPFLSRTFCTVHPCRDALVRSRVQPPPLRVMSQYVDTVLSTGCIL